MKKRVKKQLKEQLMKQMKKIPAMLLTVLMLCIGFAGCGSEKLPDVVRVGSMKGPTSMGLMFMMEKNEAGKAENH